MSSTSTKKTIKIYASAFISQVLPQLEMVISPFLSKFPSWQLAFHEAIGLYGYYMAIKQEEVNEYIEFIKSNPKIFREEIVASKEFKNGFVIAFQDYLKLRTKEKKDAAKKIFLDFAKSETKYDFELERFDNALYLISPSALKFLSFVVKEIFPIKEKKIKQLLKERNIENSGKSYDYWYDFEWKRSEVYGYIHKWIYENYNPNSELVKKRYKVKEEWDKKLIDQVFENEKNKAEEINPMIEELINLGIFRIKVASGGGGMSMTGGSTYDFSNFGYKFIEFIESL